MKHAEFLRNEAEHRREVKWTTASPATKAVGLQHAERLDSIATLHERLAVAVVEAWADFVYLASFDTSTGYADGRIDQAIRTVVRATGKHPSEWTREELEKYLEADDE